MWIMGLAVPVQQTEAWKKKKVHMYIFYSNIILENDSHEEQK